MPYQSRETSSTGTEQVQYLLSVVFVSPLGAELDDHRPLPQQAADIIESLTEMVCADNPGIRIEILDAHSCAGETDADH